MNLKKKEELDRWRMGERPARQRQPRDHRHKALRPACGERFMWLKHEGVWLEIRAVEKKPGMPGGRSRCAGGPCRQVPSLGTEIPICR